MNYTNLKKFIENIYFIPIDSDRLQSVSLFERIISVYYFKSDKMLNASIILCDKGFSFEACKIIRSAINQLIDLKWMINDGFEINERMQRYIDFEVMIKYSDIQKFNDIPKDKENTVNQIKEQFSKLRIKYNIKDDKIPYRWADKPIQERAKEAKLKDYYEKVYCILSRIEHADSSPTSIRGILDRGKEWFKCLVLSTMVEVFLLVKKEYIKALKLDTLTIDNELKNFKELCKNNDN